MMRFAFLVLLVCCICSADMERHYLNETVDGYGVIGADALCLDGSPGAYYFKAGSDANRTKWVIHLRGGGLCMHWAECVGRTYTIYGTTDLAEWGETLSYGGPLSEDPVYNPDFYDWNHVFLVYCDGGSFSGHVDDPVPLPDPWADYKTRNIYFRGHRILEATLDYLLITKGLDRATDVLVVGDSAGGLAAFYNADWIGEKLREGAPPRGSESSSYYMMIPRPPVPSSSSSSSSSSSGSPQPPVRPLRYKVSPFSGIFLDRPNADGECWFRKTCEEVFKMHNCSAGVNQRCLEAHPDKTWKCGFAEYISEYIDTPLFATASPYDQVGVECIIAAGPLYGPTETGVGNCSAIPGWETCTIENFMCSNEQWYKIEEYANEFRRIMETGDFAKDGNGLFEYSCYNHSVESGPAWNETMVNGVSMREAVARWFFSDNEPFADHLYKDCDRRDPQRCNPTCLEPEPPLPPEPEGGVLAAAVSPVTMALIGAAFMALYHAI